MVVIRKKPIISHISPTISYTPVVGSSFSSLDTWQISRMLEYLRFAWDRSCVTHTYMFDASHSLFFLTKQWVRRMILYICRNSSLSLLTFTYWNEHMSSQMDQFRTTKKSHGRYPCVRCFIHHMDLHRWPFSYYSWYHHHHHHHHHLLWW